MIGTTQKFDVTVRTSGGKIRILKQLCWLVDLMQAIPKGFRIMQVLNKKKCFWVPRANGVVVKTF